MSAVTGIRPGLFAGKHVVITGAGRGIGAAIAGYLLADGATVFAHLGREGSREHWVFPSAGSESAGLTTCCGDLSDEKQVKSIAKLATDKLGHIDVLINNAGINPIYGPIEEAPSTVFDKLININVKAIWALSNFCLPHMKKNGGSIINSSSVEGLHPGFGLGLYSMSKAAVLMLTKNQAKEWGKYGVRSNAICPGLVKTKLSQALWSNEKMLSHLENNIPAGRMAMPEEMTGLALLLASDAGSYMTGGVYTADGGYLLAG